MDAVLPEPVLIIKTAWRGKSLHTDFRPPSAGPYVLNEFQRKLYYGPAGHGVPKDMEQWLAEKKRDTGHGYRFAGACAKGARRPRARGSRIRAGPGL